MLAARRVGRPREVGRGPSREPARRRQVAPRARRRSRWRSTATARSRLRPSTSRPTAAPTRLRGRSCPAAAVGALFPGPYRVPAGRVRDATVYTNTVGRTAYRGPWQFESLAREVLLDIAARRMAIDPVELRRRNLLRRDELPYTNPIGMTYDAISPARRPSSRRWRCSTTTRSARSRPAAAERAATSASGTSSYVEPIHAGLRRSTAPRAATIRIEPSGKGQRLRRRGLHRQQPGDDGGPAHRRRAGRTESTDVHTIQGDTAVTGFGAGAGGSRSASMTAGAVDDDGRDPARAHQGHRGPPARSGGRGHRAGRWPRLRTRDASHRRLRTQSSPTSPTSTPPRSRRACPPVSRRRARYARRRLIDLGRTRRTSARARSTWRRARSRSCATSSARTAGR